MLPSTAKIASGIEKALREVDVRKTAQRWGREIEQGIGKPKVEVTADTTKAKKKIDEATDGPLEMDSVMFQRPDAGHRASPWARTTLKLHSVASAQSRYNGWAAVEFDKHHAGSPGGWFDEDGKHHEHPRPKNPFTEKVST